MSCLKTLVNRRRLKRIGYRSNYPLNREVLSGGTLAASALAFAQRLVQERRMPPDHTIPIAYRYLYQGPTE